MSELDGLSGAATSDQEPTAKFDRADLVRGWREYEAAVPRCVPVVKFAAKTDMGQVRENNEDKFEFYEPEAPSILAARGCLYAVADGIGGAQAGQIASETMLKKLIANYYDSAAPDLVNALYDSIVATNDYIFSLAQMIPERNGMGTTLTGVVFIEDRVIVAQVGDSRAYLIRDGAVRQVTLDHSWVEEQVRAGLMTRQAAEMSPFRNVITRSIGAMPNVEPEFFEEQARPGDVWVLCSDGLSGYVSDDEIGHIAGSQSPSEAARQFLELANARGGRDNITAFVIGVRELRPYTPESPSVAWNGAEALASQHGAALPVAETPPEASQAPQPTGLRKLFGRG
jgi:serine/threonine protein phosphatase PrpC